MQRVLVTGGAGFIGSHTIDLLLAEGLQVVAYDNLITGQPQNLNLSHSNLTLIEADVLDYDALRSAIQGCDAVLHLAAISSVPKSIEDPVNSLRVNTQGFLHVLHAIQELKRPIRCVYASSAAVYGCVAQLPCSDEKPLPQSALSPYALEKANNERYADLFERLFGIKSLGLRYFNVFGTRQDPSSPYAGVIAKFVEQYQQDKSIMIFGDGEQSRDFIHVSDVARANLLALQGSYHGVLNIATGVPETLRNLVHYIEGVRGRPAQVEFAPLRVGDIKKSYATIEKAERQLGFRYTVNFQEGIRSLLETR